MSRRLTYMQIEHLRARACQAFNKIRDAQLKALGPQPERPELSKEKKLEMILNGKAKANPDMIKSTRYAQVTDFFTFPLSAEQRRQENKYKVWWNKREEISMRVHAEEEEFTDRVILGDSVEAMEMLKGLELRVQKV